LPTLKFFPCKAAGGTGALNMLAPVFSDVVFCPTGGLTADDFRDYLATSNVIAAGGTWMMSKDALAKKDWAAVTKAAKAALGEEWTKFFERVRAALSETWGLSPEQVASICRRHA
jgi:2-keto-3-deoxy-6-phosphogluconate aldolase